MVQEIWPDYMGKWGYENNHLTICLQDVLHSCLPSLRVAIPDLIKIIHVRDFHLFRNRRIFEIEEVNPVKSYSRSKDDDWKRLRVIISSNIHKCEVEENVLSHESMFQSILAKLWDASRDRERDWHLDNSCNFTIDVIG